MRSAQKSNRSRGRGNRKGGGGGNNINRVYDSAGPEGKVRGTPQQIIDKYVSLARDAQTSGDRVAAENFLQHAEHYQRILTQAMATQEQSRRESQDAQTGAAEEQVNGGGQPDLPAAEAPAAPSEQIGGMATIDTTPDEGGLLVDSAGDTSHQNGDGRRRRRKPSNPDQGGGTDEAAPDAPVES